MSAAQTAPQPITRPLPVATEAEAAELMRHFNEVMDALIEVVQQETELVRAGRVSAASRMQATKLDLTRLYIAATLRLRASHAYLSRAATDGMKALHARHEHFRAQLQLNMTVLATAHAVSESIVRGVSDELARKAAPQAYGASGYALNPGRSAAPPMAVSRTL